MVRTPNPDRTRSCQPAPDPRLPGVPGGRRGFARIERGVQLGQPGVAVGGAHRRRLARDVGAGQVEEDLVVEGDQAAPDRPPPGARRGERRDQTRIRGRRPCRRRPAAPGCCRSRAAGAGRSARSADPASSKRSARSRRKASGGLVVARLRGRRRTRRSGRSGRRSLDPDGPGDPVLAVPVLGQQAGQVAAQDRGPQRVAVALVGERRLEREPVDRPRQEPGVVDLGDRVAPEEDQAGQGVGVRRRSSCGIEPRRGSAARPRPRRRAAR